MPELDRHPGGRRLQWRAALAALALATTMVANPNGCYSRFACLSCKKIKRPHDER